MESLYQQLTQLILRCEQQKPSPAAVSLLFDLMVNGTFSIQKAAPNQFIMFPEFMPILLSILPKCSTSVCLEIFIKFTQLAARSYRNLETMRNRNVLADVMKLYNSHLFSEEMIGGKVLKFMATLAQYNTSVFELKSFFRVIKSGVEENDVKKISKVIGLVQEATGKQGPTAFFDSNGTTNCGILISPFKITGSGYSFSLWIRLEKEEFIVTRNQTQSPRILSLLNKDGEGVIISLTTSSISAALHNENRISEQSFKFSFVEDQWHFVTITHMPRYLGRSEMKLYVNGEIIGRVPLGYPPSSKIMQVSSIGATLALSSYRITEQPSFYGQIGCILLIDGILNDKKIIQLSQTSWENPSTINEIAERNNIIWSFHPRACEKNLVFDTCGSTHGIIVGSMKAVHISSIQDAFYCAGGISLVYPIIYHLDTIKVTTEHKKDSNLLTQLFILLSNLMAGHINNQKVALEDSSIHIIAYLLQQVSTHHFEDSVFAAIQQLMSSCKEMESLTDEIVLGLFFNFRLWSRLPFHIQKSFLIGPFMKSIASNTKFYRRVFSVQKMLDVLFKFYPYKTEETDNLSVTQIYELRSIIINAISIVLYEDPTIEEVTALIHYIHDCGDHRETSEILHLILRMLCKEPAEQSKLYSIIEEIGGAAIFFVFLRSTQSLVQILCLKVVGKLLQFTKSSQRHKLLKRWVHGWILPTFENYPTNLGSDIYTAILEVLLDKITPSIDTTSDNKLLDLESIVEIANPAMIPVIFGLVLKVDVQLKLKIIQDFMILFSHAKSRDEEKQSIDIRIVFLEQKGWQKWLFDIIYQVKYDVQMEGKDSTEAQVVSELILNLLDLLLHFSLANLENGWKLLTETEIYLYQYPSNVINQVAIIRKIYTSAISFLVNNMTRLVKDENTARSRIAPVVANLVLLVDVFVFSPPIQEQESKVYDKSPKFDQYMHRSLTDIYEIQTFNDDYDYEGNSTNKTDDPHSKTDRIGKWEDYDLCCQLLTLVEFFLKPPLRDFLATANNTFLGRDSFSVYTSLTRIMISCLQESEHIIDNLKLNNRIAEIDTIEALLSGLMNDMLSTTSNRSKLLLYINTKKKETLTTSKSTYKIAKSLVNKMSLLIASTLAFHQLNNNLQQAKKLTMHITCTIVYHLFYFSWRSMRKGTEAYRAIINPFKQIIRDNLPDKNDTLLDEVVDSRDNFFIVNSAVFETKEKELFVQFLTVSRVQSVTITFLQQRGTVNMESLWQKSVPLLWRRRNENFQEYTKQILIMSKEYEKITTILTQETNLLTQKYSTKEVQRKLYVSYLEGKTKLRIEKMWKSKLRELTHPGAVWGIEVPNQSLIVANTKEMIFWKLGKHELGHRMRRKMKRNHRGSVHREAAFSYWKENYDVDKSKQEQEKLNQQLVEVKKSMNAPAPLPSVELDSEDIINNVFTESLSAEFNMLENQNSQSLMEEKISFESSCDLVHPEITVMGRIELYQSKILFIYDRTQSITDEHNEQKVSNYHLLVRKAFEHKLRDREWSISNIISIYSRRYLLNWTAIEIFFLDGRNYFFNLPVGKNESFFKALMALKPPKLLNSFFGHSSALFKKRQEYTEKWKRREISNFDYLMILNTMSGRSYNDITQYPVFPWILSNYNSPVIDLNDPSNYRDLSKPVGCLDAERAQKFKERYECFQDDSVPPFHYGSHYSTAGAVLFYLLRLEPFTSQLICLQSGKFDIPDRLFFSIPDTWNNCLKSSSDVKELIPEFFYLPEFLVNSNGFDLGKRFNGAQINHVELPAWANSPEEFIQINQQALESEYVSQNLNNWIDLIFGYKQTGEEAVKAMNCFYYLTYEGAVDLSTLSDPQMLESIRTQIENFGQTPTQLLTTPHPKRNPPSAVLYIYPLSVMPSTFFSHCRRTVHQLPFSSPFCLYTSSKKIITINTFGEYLIHTFKVEDGKITSSSEGKDKQPFKLELDSNYSSVSSPNSSFLTRKDVSATRLLQSLKTLYNGNKRVNIYSFLHHTTESDDDLKQFDLHYRSEISRVKNSVLVEDDPNTGETKVITIGNFSKSIEVSKLDNFIQGQKVVAPIQATQYDNIKISCIHYDGPWFVAGSFAGVIVVWTCRDSESSVFGWTSFLRGNNEDLRGLVSHTNLSSSRPLLSDFKLSEKPTHILHCHNSPVTTICVSTNLDIIVSAAEGGFISIHNLTLGTHLNCINLSGTAIDKITINQTLARMVLYSHSTKILYLYSTNGNFIASQNIKEEVSSTTLIDGTISSMILTQNGQFLITGGGSRLCIRPLHNLSVMHEYKLPGNIYDVALDPEEKLLLISLEDGKLVVYYKISGGKILM